MVSEATQPHSGRSQSIGARVLIAGPPCEGLAAALDALHRGAEGPIRSMRYVGGCWEACADWVDANDQDEVIDACRHHKPHVSIMVGKLTLVLVTPGDTSGAAAMAREAGVEVREVGE